MLRRKSLAVGGIFQVVDLPGEHESLPSLNKACLFLIPSCVRLISPEASLSWEVSLLRRTPALEVSCTLLS